MSTPTPEKDPKKVFEERQIQPVETAYYEKVEALVGKFLESDIGKTTNADTETAQLIYKFKQNGIHEVFEKVREKLKNTSAENLSSVVDDINQATEYLNQYMDYITAVMLAYAAQDDDKEGTKNKLNIRELYRLNIAAKGILDAHNRGYGRMTEKIARGDKLTLEEEKRLVQGLKSLPTEPGNHLEQIQNSGAWAVVATMSPPQRYNFAAVFIQEKPADAKSFLEGMTISGILTVAQAKKLWPGKGFPEKDLQEKQQKVITMKAEIEARVATTHDDRNQISRFLEPKNLAGIVLQVWGITEMILNGATMAKAGDWGGFASNPWFLGGAAAAIAGHGINTKGDMFAAIKEPSASDKEAKESEKNTAEIGKILTRYPTEFQKIDWEIVAKDMDLIRKNEAAPSRLTLADVIAGMKTKNAKKPSKAYKERIASLEMIQNASDTGNTGTKLALNEALELMLKTPAIVTAANINTIYQEAERTQGLAQKKPIIKPAV